jgi:hypothetical protein
MEISAGKVATILTIVGFLVGGAYALEDRYVNESENIQNMQQMQMYYDAKLDKVQYDFLQDKRIMLERKLQDSPNNPRALEDLHAVQDKLNAIDQRMMTR